MSIAVAEATTGIPVHPLEQFYSPEELQEPGRQNLVGVLVQAEVNDFVTRRRASETGLQSDLKEGECILIYGTLKLFLTVDSHVVRSLETAVDGNGYAETQAGLTMLDSAGLIRD